MQTAVAGIRESPVCLHGLLVLYIKIKKSHEGTHKTSGPFLAVGRPAGGGAMSSRLMGSTRGTGPSSRRSSRRRHAILLRQSETPARRSAVADGAAPRGMPTGAERPRGHEPRGRTPPVCAGSALPGDTQECFPALAEVCPGAPPLRPLGSCVMQVTPYM